jgi:SAM-dependent methyltransferase
MQTTGANSEQIEYWNEQAGPKCVALQERLDAHIGALGERALAAAAPAPGERVLDVGCGCGATALALAHRIGPAGSTLGIDLSAAMLARARERARDAGLSNLEFLQADAQTHVFEPGFDLVFSRFGVMFFDDPAAAFANLRRALRPGGRTSFVCWQPIQANPWMLVPLQAAAQHVELPAPAPPGSPGPFAFGDPEHVGSILKTAGFEAASFESVETQLGIGGATSLDEAVDFLLEIGPAARVLREVGQDVQERVRLAIGEALSPFVGRDGVHMGCAVWLVSARSA